MSKITNYFCVLNNGYVIHFGNNRKSRYKTSASLIKNIEKVKNKYPKKECFRVFKETTETVYINEILNK